VRLTVESSGQCPGREVFLAQLEARSARVREARADEDAPAMRVELAEDDGQVFGRLIYRPRDGPLEGRESRRELRGTECASVAAGLALVAAVILDPSAAVGVEVELFAPLPDRASPAARPPGAEQRKPLPPIRSSPHAHLSLGAAVEVAAGLGPNPGVMARGFVDLELPPPLSAASNRLSLGRSDARSVDTTSGTAQIKLTDIRWEPCIDAWSPAAWHIRACGVVEGGVVNGEGTNTNGARTANRTLAELGGGLRANWLIHDLLTLGFMVGLSTPLARYRFYFSSPDTTAYELALWSAFGEFSMGLRFW